MNAALEAFEAVKCYHFFVEGKPVPWSVPDVGMAMTKSGKRVRFAKKNPLLTNWQKDLARAARAMYGPVEPWEGLVLLDLEFRLELLGNVEEGTVVVPEYRVSDATGKHGKKGWLPDRTNLIKAVEDAMNGIVYVDDTQVRGGTDLCIWSKTPGVSITISLMEKSG